MPVTIGGLSSGIDTEGIIKKLLEVEARPIEQWEKEKLRYNRRKEALAELRTRISNLNDAARDLYGFRSSYHDKKALSSHSAIEASANKRADLGRKDIQVLQLASTHKISTDPVDKDTVLPPSKFKLEVNGEAQSIRFKGGDLRSLRSRIDEVAEDIVKTSYIKTEGNKYVMTLESKVPGRKGEIKITGDKKFLQQIGLVKGVKDKVKDKVTLTFDEKYFTSYIGDVTVPEQDGRLTVEQKGKAVRVQGALWREYILPLEVNVKEDTALEFAFSYKEKKEGEEEAVPYRIEIGPEEKVVIKGIELKGYNVSRTRPLKEKKKKKEVIDIAGIGVVSKEKEKRIEKIYPLEKGKKAKKEIPIGKDFKGKKIVKVIIYCNTGEASFSDARITTPIKEKGELEPKNEIAKAGDARMKVDGVEVVRDRNDNLTDVLKGVTLSLKGVSERPVSITVEPDIGTAIDKIKKFVESYNKYLEFTKALTKAVKVEDVGEYRNSLSGKGLFMGDLTLLRLENTLKSTISNAYPNRMEEPIKMITQIGISTGAINADWETIKEGKLLIDESKLKEVIVDNPDGVAEFFGSDNDGDNRIDNGLAYQVNYILKPFAASGNNIIQSKIDLEDNSIRMTSKRIERRREHLKKYEAKLRSKFAAMEKALSGAKKQQKWMELQMKGLRQEGKQDK
jgi:flagellar hook-associated protein 2